MSAASFVFIESNTTGTGQLCLRRARAKGYRVLFLTARPELYPYLATEMVAPHVVDTSDADAICEGLAGERELAAVMSTSEYFVEMSARVAGRLSLVGPDVESVRTCRNKGQLARVLARAGVNVPETTEFASSTELEQRATSFEFPVVVKPIFGSGSVDVRLVRDPADLVTVGRELLARGRNERGIAVSSNVLVQRYLPGEEFSVEVFCVDGRHHIIGCTRKHLEPPPFFVETGHDFPARVEASTEDALRELVSAALRVVGYRSGPAHVECRLDHDGRPALIEINPRLAGGMIPRVIEMATGVDLMAALVDHFSGRRVELAPVRERFAAIRFFVAHRPGVIEAFHSPLEDGASRSTEDGVEAEFAAIKPVGVSVVPRGDFRDRLAYVVAASEQQERLDRALSTMLARPVVDMREPQLRPESGPSGRIRKLLCPEALDIVRKIPPPAARLASLDRLAAIDEAHLVMLVRAELLGANEAAPVLTEIDALRGARYAEILDQRAPRGTYLLYEQALIARLGRRVGGVVHTARSRNDINACLLKLEAREWLSTTFRALWRLRAALLAKAAGTLDVVMPMYSQFQPGQPGTLAYYLWSLDSALGRDHQALLQLVDELQVCPMGAGAGAGTDFPIRPELTAELLGFSSCHVSALDAVANRDVGLRLLGAWAVCSTTLSRLAQDLQLWTMGDVDLFYLAEDLCGGSSLMPQKQNPYLLEIVKGKLVSLPSALSFSLHAMQKAPFSNSIEVGTEAVSVCAESAATFADCCDLLRLMVAGLEPRPGRGEAAARRGVVIATQVANGLVRDRGVTFHEAHRVVGSRIADALDAGRDPLQALENLSERPLDDLRAATEALRYGGGPGAVARELGASVQALRDASDSFHHHSFAWTDAPRRRRSAVRAVIADASARASDSSPGPSDD